MEEEEDAWKVSNWPSEFVQFLLQNNIPPELYKMQLPKYIWMITKDHSPSLLLSDLQKAFPDAQPLECLPNFYKIGGESVVAASPLYKRGDILALDPSSALAVENLSLQPGEHVLDLCCAPGMKLCLMALKVAREGEARSQSGSVTGVDISPRRLATAATIAKKYRLPQVRLFVADGRNFSVGVHEILEPHHAQGLSYKQLYPGRKHARLIHCSTAIRRFPGRLGHLPYDKVLVDAQCTHDGSIKHIRKQILANWRTFDPHQYSIAGLESLAKVQLDLLEAGFRLLRPDGLLVYSTCSLSRMQNEHIIRQFLDAHPQEAHLETPIDWRGNPISIDQGDNGNAYDGILRLWPNEQSGGGLCICRVRKRAIQPKD